MAFGWSAPRLDTKTKSMGIPDDYIPFELAAQARANPENVYFHICRGDGKMQSLQDIFRFLLPGWTILTFPSWDCLPYDRLSPKKDIMGARLETLIRLANCPDTEPVLILTTAHGLIGRVPPRSIIAPLTASYEIGQSFDFDGFNAYVTRAGYSRTGTVREPGEYSIRGDIIDIFPAASNTPYRIDIFGDQIENMRFFDPLSQRTDAQTKTLILNPTSEVLLTPDTIRSFRSRYRGQFGAGADTDPIYTAISQNRPFAGMEHWMAFFYDSLESIFDYIPPRPLFFSYDFQGISGLNDRFSLISDYFNARLDGLKTRGLGPLYRPLPPSDMYLFLNDLEQAITKHLDNHGGEITAFSPFWETDLKSNIITVQKTSMDPLGGDNLASIFDGLSNRLDEYHAKNTTVLMTFLGTGSRMRVLSALEERGFSVRSVLSYDDFARHIQHTTIPPKTVFFALIPVDSGFESPDFVLLTEQDILGPRTKQRNAPKRRSDLLIAEVSALSLGDLIVHDIHGIGRYEGLQMVDVTGIRHDCLCVVYEGGDRLFVPVENLDLISRYGGESSAATLDKMGSVSFQNRKARLKKRLEEMAESLIAAAAARALERAPVITHDTGLYDEFCARFPYIETDDQLRAIDDLTNDLQAGNPMDRLICGDVGFGKTEVALRAAFLMAASGKQVAIIAPTTLLSRQHFQTFQKRFDGFGMPVAQLSRFVPTHLAKKTKEDLKAGNIAIVIGTHALLSSDIGFHDLGLVIVDEEQHFGVKQKERLKSLGKSAHLLTLTATPIPRTLQMALSGVRAMSLIATPPIDRLAVHSFILPYDGVVIKEAIMREYNRGGQMFYVCPHIEDINTVRGQLRELVPNLRIAEATGQMPPSLLDKVMTDFCDGHFDILLATNIIESGLDITNAGTIFVHRADRFGLAQLYQLKGRVGRSKNRGYAYFTIPDGAVLKGDAEKRLKVMQTLDTLGAGFSLASHDMDIRGAGNLLGGEQSGHVREVGIELYQQMLEDAVSAARRRTDNTPSDVPTEPFSPQLNLGLSILIPESYVADLNVRLNLYRRLSTLKNESELSDIQDEMVDRFGPLPEEAVNLLTVMTLKILCRKAHITKIDGGDRGLIITFHGNDFPAPDRLLSWIQTKKGIIRIRPDHKMTVLGTFNTPAQKVSMAHKITAELGGLVSMIRSN